MRYLKSFNESIQFPTDPETIRKKLVEIAFFNKAAKEIDDLSHDWTKITDPSQLNLDSIKINPDGTVDILEGGIKLILGRNNNRIPIKFGYVKGLFDLRGNNGLTDLQGSPHTCGEFRCDRLTNLKSLVGGPKFVKGYFDAEFCPLTSLEGSPEEVGEYFDVSSTNITSLVGSPKTIGGNFLARTVNLTDLVGGPQFVEAHYVIDSPNLTSLEGAPKRVGQDFDLRNVNYKLWDPRPLKDCEFGAIKCSSSSINYLIKLFEQDDNWSKSTQNFLLSLDYNYVRSDRTINLFRVKEAISEILGDDVRPSIIGRKGDLPLWEFVNDEGEYVNFDGQLIDLDGNPIRF